ncbi:MAG: RsmG family class I SAM-dependent methyltransferase [Ilumatobacteraceae bacterium]
MADDRSLVAALAVIQARGAIGERSLVDAIVHADRFVDLIPGGPRSLVDLGSGGGLPALVIGWRRPELIVTMIERRATRADLLLRAVISLGLDERCTVLTEDVFAVRDRLPHSFDVVTARSFADVATTCRCADDLLNATGIALVSEPPIDRTEVWSAVLAGHPDLADTGVHQGIRRLIRG